MRLHTLADLRLEGCAFARPKPLFLLAFLVLEGPQPRTRVAELVWPAARRPHKSLSVALSQLRGAVPQAIAAEPRRVAARLPCDASDVLARIREGDVPSARALYRGPFLEGVTVPHLGVEAEEWLFATRERIVRALQRSWLALAEGRARAGAFEVAARDAEGVLGLGSAHLDVGDLVRLHTVLAAGGSGVARDVRREARPIAGRLAATVDEARTRLAPPAGVPVPSARRSATGSRAVRRERERPSSRVVRTRRPRRG